MTDRQYESMRFSAEVVLVCIVLGVLLLGCVYIQHVQAEKAARHIERECIVYETYDNTTVFESEDGNLWEVNGIFNDVDAQYILTFDTMGTEDVTDDVITGVLKAH